MAPDQFWRCTPFQLQICVKAMVEEKLDQHDDRAWSMWHLAYLMTHRWKKFPDLSVFQSRRDKSSSGDKKPVAGVNEDAIMAFLQSAKAKHQHEQNKKAKK